MDKAQLWCIRINDVWGQEDDWRHPIWDEGVCCQQHWHVSAQSQLQTLHAYWWETQLLSHSPSELRSAYVSFKSFCHLQPRQVNHCVWQCTMWQIAHAAWSGWLQRRLELEVWMVILLNTARKEVRGPILLIIMPSFYLSLSIRSLHLKNER